MPLILVLTDGDGVAGLSATFGAYIDTSVVASQGYAQAAAASATQAASSATQSSASAAAALVSQNAASGSASSASGSASAASGSASGAATSATNASASATQAANSATSASGSATSASGSATAAATSASNAAATLANALVKANNLSDVASAATAATNLGLGTGNTPTFTNLKLSGPTAHGALIAEGSGTALAVATIGTAGRVLTDNGAGADPTFSTIGVHGTCYLAFSSTTQLTLSPKDGQWLNINGAFQQVPSAGVNLANTGLSASTLYYVYAYMVGSTMTLEAVTTAPVVATNGVVQKTGDATRTLVGMCQMSASSTFQDLAQGVVGVLSWFQRKNKYVTTNTSSGTASTSYATLATVNFLSWSDDTLLASCTGSGQNATASNHQFRLQLNAVSFGPNPVVGAAASTPFAISLVGPASVNTQYNTLTVQGLVGAGTMTPAINTSAVVRG